MNTLFTSEQVSCGHPDKICDQISDAILDAHMAKDKYSRVAIESLIKNNKIVLAGEVTSQYKISKRELKKCVSEVLADIGVLRDADWIIETIISAQSPDIALGVDVGAASDQGIIFGYACDETPEMLPLAYMIATKALLNLRSLDHPELRPDAKSQVTIRHCGGDIFFIDTFLISTQHTENIKRSEICDVVGGIMEQTIAEYDLPQQFNRLVNPTGKFVIGGSFGDCGLTGRKIIADSYGGYARHGGGCYSGKCCTKADRASAYMARHVAKYLLNKYKLRECEVQLAYAIGVAEPVSIDVRATVKPSGGLPGKSQMINDLKRHFDLTPGGIIKHLDLYNVKYYKTACYGHFTNQSFPWEKVMEY